jgi:hypothetical protein
MDSSQAAVIAALITGSAVGSIGIGTIWQKWRSDRRDAWWKRVQWAIDKSLSADPVEREIGNESMSALNQEHWLSKADRRVLQIALVRAYMDYRRPSSGT